MTSFQYYVTGKSIPWIADKLLISQRTVERDISYCKRNAKQTMRKYFTQTLPEEVLKSLARLNAVNNAAWDMAERAREKGQGKLEVDSLRLAKDTAVAITDITTNNKSVIDEAYEIVDQSEKELSKISEDSIDTVGPALGARPTGSSSYTSPDSTVSYHHHHHHTSSSSNNNTEAQGNTPALNDNGKDNGNDSLGSSSSRRYSV